MGSHIAAFWFDSDNLSKAPKWYLGVMEEIRSNGKIEVSYFRRLHGSDEHWCITNENLDTSLDQVI